MSKLIYTDLLLKQKHTSQSSPTLVRQMYLTQSPKKKDVVSQSLWTKDCRWMVINAHLNTITKTDRLPVTKSGCPSAKHKTDNDML